MASLAAIRTALVDTISAGVSGVRGYANVPKTINAPAFIVMPRTSDFGKAFGRGLDGYTFDVLVLASARDEDLAQLELDPFVTGAGSSSIREVIWNARTLGLAGVEATVTGMSDYNGQFTLSGADYIGARLTVEVTTSGTA